MGAEFGVSKILNLKSIKAFGDGSVLGKKSRVFFRMRKRIVIRGCVFYIVSFGNTNVMN